MLLYYKILQVVNIINVCDIIYFVATYNIKYYLGKQYSDIFTDLTLNLIGFTFPRLIPQLALDSNKRLFTFGFGGYGRLGHNGNKDEMVPRLLNQFIGM